ncbi:hypothetical protein [Aeromicrobium sp. Leaf350]|uniref:hypothetical protein n=1 Tax=Aeromicrobium sp. Leaf350 TaxID=2876565 RepID=UPI001E46CE5D|nr:hypothetical protein [Aeromicrobium sp. Leaf350]
MDRSRCPDLERFFTLISVGIVAGSVTELQARVKWETVRRVLQHVESGAVHIDDEVDEQLRLHGIEPTAP